MNEFPDITSSVCTKPIDAVDSVYGISCAESPPTKALYFALNKAKPTQMALDAARRHLDTSIQEVDALDCDLPNSLEELEAWIGTNTAAVGAQYQAYLDGRKCGKPRAYFTTKSHALFFLRGVAPTKTVDGAWLYGLLKHWNDGRFASLIRIYLEELGEGLPDKNHVVLYKKLLAAHGCDQWASLPDSYFVQGVIQLALAYHSEHFLPEIIGFNLGYEQLPLHLLITAYELNELGIDPYYFTLHVTVDNADTGHAQNALTGLREAWPVLGDSKRFYQRVVNGYKLNMLGVSTNAVIEAFNLEHALIEILKEKSVAGRQVHSDYCRIAGRSVNDWLKNSEEVPTFLAALERAGWIKRHRDPEESRFWKLLQGDRAEMFGVFNTYELQVIYDWIKGEAVEMTSDSVRKRALTFKARQKLHETLDRRETSKSVSGDRSVAKPTLLTNNNGYVDLIDDATDYNAEERRLENLLNQLSNRDQAMDTLVTLISPAYHHTAIGLKATRRFSRMFF